MSLTVEEKKIKLTKSCLSKFIRWSSSRYNSYLDYGNKKQNVDTVYNSLKAGFYTDERGKQDESKIVFEIHSAGSVGENGSGRYWRTTQTGGTYKVDCIEKTIEDVYRNEKLFFA